jgi:hypothetical protein
MNRTEDKMISEPMIECKSGYPTARAVEIVITRPTHDLWDHPWAVLPQWWYDTHPDKVKRD